MRVAIISKSKRHTRIYYYFKKAFQQLGHRVIWLKYPKIKKYFGEKGADRISRLVLTRFQPDLLFFHGLDISPALLALSKNRIPVIMYFDDCLRMIDDQKFEKLIRLARQADIFYLTNRGEISLYRKQGVNARFITGGCDPDAHYPVSLPPAVYHSEVAFIGKPNTPERVAFLRQVAQTFDLKIWGSGWSKLGLQSHAAHVYAPEYRKICAGAKIVLGWNVDSGLELYFSNRTWYTLACGGFLLTHYSPRLEELFNPGGELDWFTTIDEGLDKIRYYLNHEEKRQNIARAGYRLVHEKYRYTDLVQRMMSDLNENR